MKITVANFQKSDAELYKKLVEDIAPQEFPELDRLFDELRVLIGNNDDVKNGLFERQEKEFLGNTKLVSLTKKDFDARSWANPPKALIEMNLSLFASYPEWKKRLAIRHECCHLLHFEKSPKVFDELVEQYGESYLNALVKFRAEYCAHSCIIQRCPNDWIKEPVGFRKAMPSPKLSYSKMKAQIGAKAAVEMSIQNIIHLLSLSYLYEKLPDCLKSKVRKKRKLADRYLGDFFQAMKKDVSADFPPPEKWLSSEDFFSAEIYYAKIKKLLALMPR